MSAILLSGKEMEKELLTSQIERCQALKEKGIHPLLAVIVVGRESQHARPPCPSPTPGVHSDSRPSSP